jgi:phage terminase small subunit
MVKLRQKQEKFVLEYFKTGNAASAAVMAGYSVKSVRSIASQLLTNINIKARLAELQEKAESVKIASVVERKQILTEILRAKLTDFMELGKDGSWVNIGPETKNSRAIKTIRSRTEYDENADSPTIYTTVELTSPIEAIKELNKMERIYDDSTKVNVSIDQRQLNIYDLSSLSDQELDNLEQIVRKITPVSITDSSREETP